MSYACPNCTSAGGPNWVEYLVEMHPMQYWNLAYNSAPISNALVGQVCVCVKEGLKRKRIDSVYECSQHRKHGLYT